MRAAVLVRFEVNETSLPPEFGPLYDLDGDGMLDTPDISASYLLLPARLTITYPVIHGPETKVMCLVLGQR